MLKNKSLIGRLAAVKRAVFLALLAAAILAVLSASASGKSPNHKTDGTNVWIGAASGGSMKELSNWKALVGGAEHTDATSVSNLFMKHVTLDIRSLAHGAVLTNDINFGNTYNESSSSGYTMVAGIIYAGQDGDEVSFVNGGGKTACLDSALLGDETCHSASAPRR